MDRRSESDSVPAGTPASATAALGATETGHSPGNAGEARAAGYQVAYADAGAVAASRRFVLVLQYFPIYWFAVDCVHSTVSCIDPVRAVEPGPVGRNVVLP